MSSTLATISVNVNKRDVMDLTKRFERLSKRACKLDGTVYRSCAPKYATSSDLLSGEGSRLYGGRWNPKGVTSVYGSFDPETAMAETLAGANYFGVPVHSTMPRVFVAFEFKLSEVLNLTDGSIRKSLGISESRMMDCDWRRESSKGADALTQAIGRAASEAGLEAILVASAAIDEGENLVVFVNNLRRGSHLALVSPDKLI
jgi:RES domain-containing protein